MISVPKYLPTNQKVGYDLNHLSGTPIIPAGYSGMYYVYVDTSGNGMLDRPNSFIETDSQAPAANREAFRNFTLAASVAPDERIAVTSGLVDLGTLAEGAGYTPAAPGPVNALFDPWSGAY